MRATGDFDVKLQPLDTFSKGTEGINIGRMAVEKTFKGDLDGRNGTFVLQHFGVMGRGLNRLVLETVPDPETGGLRGLTGTMTIAVKGGRHTYELDYSLTE